jgi:hypothetical protein
MEAGMAKINYRRVLLGGLLAAVVLVVAEVIVEALILGNIPGIGSERERLGSLGMTRENWSVVNNLIQLLIPILSCFLMVWVYAAMRPRFGPGPKTALLTGAVFLGNWLILLIYFTNVGLLPLKISIISFIDNLIVIPAAVLAGARIYREE